MRRRLRHKQLQSYTGYLEWDQETKELALENLLNDYINAAGPFIDATLFVADLAEVLQDDILYFELEEEFEICQLLTDLYNEIC